MMDQGYNKTSDTRAYLVKDILGNTTTRKQDNLYMMRGWIRW